MSLKDFQIISKLGDGAYSTVYKVHRSEDNHIYALKRVKIPNLNAKEKENALNQVRILASVRHPNIISYKEAFIDEPTKSLCIIMEFANERDLSKRITEQHKKTEYMSEGEIWSIFIQVVRGLRELHSLNIFHRDIKPANIFLHEGGTVKLGDLNVSKITEKGFCMTQTGTPYYASPEVWNDQPYDEKSDIWSLGCVLYEMITFKPPFMGEDMEALCKKVTRGIYQRLPSQFSQDLSNMIRSLLQTNSELRPSCEKILNLPSVQKRAKYNSYQGCERSELLRTIKADNFYALGDVLPRPNYHPVKMKKAKGIRSLIDSLEDKEMCEVESLPALKKEKKMSPSDYSERKHSKDKPTIVISDRKKSEIGSARSGLEVNGVNCQPEDSRDFRLPRVQNRYQKVKEKVQKQGSLKCY